LHNLRLVVAAFGDPGHAFPAIALARALADRGHEVVVETWEHWQEAVERTGLRFAAAQEYRVFPPPVPGADAEPNAADAAKALLPLLEEMQPHLVVSDILTLAPSLAAEAAGVPRATLIPHLYPVQEPGLPFFAVGSGPPRTPIGRAAWRAATPLLESGLRRGRRELNETRAVLDLPPLERYHGGISDRLAMVATFPQLEYPRDWPDHVHVTGPLTFDFERPEISLPAGDEPLVLIAPSTTKDPESRLVRSSLEALAGEPVRVVATLNGHRPEEPIAVPDNAVVVDWVSYSQVMPQASLVVCHGGHGTVVRALADGVPLLVSPVAGDMSETAARVAWSGVGLTVPWRLCLPTPLRWAMRRLLRDERFSMRAAELATWSRIKDGAISAVDLVERHGDAAVS
jgi:MGT family glycosyltransferase